MYNYPPVRCKNPPCGFRNSQESKGGGVYNDTAQRRWWPEGLSQNDQFSTGFIRFSASVDAHVPSSGNTNAFLMILDSLLWK